MNLNAWAIRWDVPFAAVEDLRRGLGVVDTDPKPSDAAPESEAAVQTRVRLEASRKGGRLFRNNVGACYTEDGSFVRYGLANDSKALNKVLKSSDLIGIRPVQITPEHVGSTLGVFVAREVKPQGWHFTGTKREVAQLAWLNLILSLGGDAAFANREGTL